ncbi:MAG: asparagine synthase C-terminal domain-containing protein, partial [Nitrospirae bacterium]|nr:asparagine synthase C-terminal domain-containing protein [Nitrospirota bacterium]
EAVLDDSVNARLVSDVEVGSLLSGGIDSSLISAMYSRQRSSPIHTFSIGYNAYKQYDELAYAQQAAEHIHSIHHTRTVSREDFLNAFEMVTYYLDEPLNDSACVPTYLLSKLVKENGIKVILTGEGSDEAFLGYHLYFEMSRFYDLQNN